VAERGDATARCLDHRGVTWLLDRQRNTAAIQTKADDRLETERIAQRERARSDVIALLVAAEEVRLGVVEEFNRVALINDPAEKEAARKEASAKVARLRAVVSEPVQSLVISAYPTLRDAAQKMVDASRVDNLGELSPVVWNDSLVNRAKELATAAAKEFSPEESVKQSTSAGG
jgi:hypothetical protein